MSVIADVEYLTIPEAVKRFPIRPHRNTIVRWMRTGCGGTILKSFKCGHKRVTTTQYIQDFLNEVNANAPQPKPAILTPRQKAAEARLDAMLSK